jgi:phosphatidylinositol alpha-mannosyltransferase
MRVAMLHVDLPPAGRGGVAFQVDLLARTLAARGHEVVVFTTAGGPADGAYETRLVPVGGPSWSRRLWGVARAFRAADLRDFDVVHAHGDDWLLGRRPRRVRTFYGSAAAEALSARSAKRVAGQGFAYVAEWAAAAEATVSVAIARNNRRYLPVVRDVVPCAVAPAFHDVTPCPSPEPTVLYVAGTLGGRKRGRLVLDAFREVRAKWPDARLVLACPETADEPGVVHRPGLPTGALAALYAESWALCSGSAYEGFGVPYVEALAAGLPVVTTDNPGAGEVLDGGRLGVVTTPERLAADLVALLADEPRRAALSRDGRAAAARYAADAVAAAYEARYARVADA